MKKQIRICGFGGQGIVLAGIILGEAAVRAGYEAVQTQSYGPEARGGAARAEVVICDAPIDYPRVLQPDVTVALSQPGYDKYAGSQANNGLVVVDSDLVEAPGAVALPFTKTAESVGHRIVANMVMLGYIGALIEIIPPDVLAETVLQNVPAHMMDLNRQAVQAGHDLYGDRPI